MENLNLMRTMGGRFESGGGFTGESRGLVFVGRRAFDADSPMPAAPGVSLVQRLWSRRWLIGLCVLAGVAVAGLYATIRPKIYTRSSQIAVEPTSAKALGENAGIAAYLNTQAELIGGSTAIHLETLALVKDQHHWPLKSFPAGADPVAVLRKGLDVTAGHNDNTISVRFSAPFSDEAAYVLRALVQAYTEFTTDQRDRNSKDTYGTVIADSDRLNREIHDQRAKLAEIEGEISLLEAQQDVGAADNRILVALADEVKSAHIRAINSKGEFERAARSLVPDARQLEELITNGRYLGQVVTAGQDLTQAKSELYLAQARLKELNERYLPNHPAVQAAQHKVDDATAAYVLALHHEWVAAGAREKDFEASFAEEKRRMSAAVKDLRARLAAKQAQAGDIKQVIDRDRKVTDGLASRIVELGAADRGSVRVEMISEADPAGPPDRVRPDRGRAMLVGLLVGLVLGVSLALADQRVRSVEEVSAAAGVRILGVIPHMPRSHSDQTRGRRVHLDPMSDVAEAYRAVRTALLFGPRARTLLVTSAERGEGKSTLAANLAIAMTETGNRVLLMDADLRVPSQHRIFGADNDVGVSSLVAGRAAVERAIYATSIRGLELMPCGPAPFNPSETINNQMFANVLAEMGARYDCVVVDSPPVLTVTDARILGAMCELTVMVVRAGRSNRRAIADARDGLLGFGANVLGVVVNDGGPDRRRYGYYGGGYASAPRDAAAQKPVREMLQPEFAVASRL